MTIKTENTAYVIFFPDEQEFLAGSSRTFRRSKDFTKARLFPRESYAKNSIATNSYRAVIIPVQTTLDPKHLFTAILKGAPKENVKV
jgi:hypothetical protein